MAKLTRRTLTVAGADVRVVIYQTVDGWTCEFDSQRNPGDGADFLRQVGGGETPKEAVRAYVRNCYDVAGR